MSEPTPEFHGLIQAFRFQAAACEPMGSPFSAAILNAAADDIDARGPVAGIMARWRGGGVRDLLGDAVPLRLLGALHDLAQSGDDPALTSAYPTDDHPGDATAAWPAALAAMARDPERFERFVDHEPQTNEVRRSACLMPGFLWLAKRAPLPIRQFEIGASAGLNQLWDRYAYHLGDQARWGPADAGVEIPTDWRGALPPLDAPISVAERRACDRKPINLEDAAARRRLRAYVWADQRDRLARLEAAIAATRAAGIRVEAADAVDWTAAEVAPRDGALTVLFHSVFWQYLPADSQSALARVIAEIGGKATDRAPFAWLRMEPPPTALHDMDLKVTLWPGAEETALAKVHPHGAFVAWSG